jgi:LPS-assembly lipoprotein
MSSHEAAFYGIVATVRGTRQAMTATIKGAAVALVLAAGLAGCSDGSGLRPLYAGGASGPVATSLAAIDVVPVEGRVGQVVQNELMFAVNSARNANPGAPPQYRLEITVLEGNQAAIVDPFSGRPEVVSLTLTANYVLRAAGAAPSSPPLKRGSTFARASYNASLQRFANIRAQRDAEDRAAKVLSDQIRTQVAGFFAARS